MYNPCEGHGGDPLCYTVDPKGSVFSTKLFVAVAGSERKETSS